MSERSKAGAGFGGWGYERVACEIASDAIMARRAYLGGHAAARLSELECVEMLERAEHITELFSGPVFSVDCAAPHTHDQIGEGYYYLGTDRRWHFTEGE